MENLKEIWKDRKRPIFGLPLSFTKYTLLEEKNVSFFCPCSKDSFSRSLLTLGSKTLTEILNEDGRVVIITFHSLEDRLVKRKFKDLSSIKDDLRIPKKPEEIEKAKYELINNKAIIASKEEIERNPRAKSGKVRGVRKIWQK